MEMTNNRVYLTNGYEIVFQRFHKDASHLYISDGRIYPDEDSRSEERWRRDGLCIPINNDEDIKKIKKLSYNEIHFTLGGVRVFKTENYLVVVLFNKKSK